MTSQADACLPTIAMWHVVPKLEVKSVLGTIEKATDRTILLILAPLLASTEAAHQKHQRDVREPLGDKFPLGLGDKFPFCFSITACRRFPASSFAFLCCCLLRDDSGARAAFSKTQTERYSLRYIAKSRLTPDKVKAQDKRACQKSLLTSVNVPSLPYATWMVNAERPVPVSGSLS